MRLLFCIHTINPSSGGPAATLRQVIPELVARGHEVEVLCLDPAGSAPWQLDYPCPLHCLGPASSGYGFCWRFLTWLLKNVERFDAVVVRGLWQWVGLASAVACTLRRKSYVVYVHGMLDPWFAKRYPLKHIKKQCYWLLAEYWVLRAAKAVVFTTTHEKQAAEGAFWPSRFTKQVLRYGIAECPFEPDVAKQAFLTRFPELVEQDFVLCLGRIHEKKGLDLVLRGFAQAGDSEDHLVFAGPGIDSQYGQSLKQLAEQLGVSKRVHYLGMIEGELKWGCLLCAKVLAQISHQENFGVSVVEALSCAKPVLLSDAVAIAEVVNTTGAGLVAAPSEEGSVRLFAEFTALTPQEREQMASAAKKVFAREYSISSAAESLLECLTSRKQ